MSIYNSDVAVVQAIDWLERNGMSLDAIAAAQKANPEHFRAAVAQIAYSESQVDRHVKMLGETWTCINQLASGVA
jgi:DNA-binding transcriptional MerR regulator